LPYPINQWYWNPSRIIPANDQEITEFPFFTFIYADLHAHMMVMPVALLALAWAVSMVLWGKREQGPGSSASGPPDRPDTDRPIKDRPIKDRQSLEEGWTRGSAPTWLALALSFFLGGLASGAIYPMNLSDRYTYLALGVVAVAYSTWRYAEVSFLDRLSGLPKLSRRLLVTGVGVVAFVALNMLLFKPYSDWYGQAYGALELWKGNRTPIWAYLTHWGLFLFIIVSWLFWETRDWMAHTPLSSARKLARYSLWIYTALAALVLLMFVQQAFVMGYVTKVYTSWKQVSVVWLIVPLAAWAGALILRPGQPEAKRVVLFLVGTGLVITLLVENVVVVGDIGRMNTVFKFYLQVWALFAVCAAAALGWLWDDIHAWLISWRIPWKTFLVALLVGAGLYTYFGGRAKIEDRMTPSAPHTLDGMLFMDYSTYDYNGTFDVTRDYRAIRWVQENIQGSPVIVEANIGDNYRWFNRFTMYTGLPSPLGYLWHQQQQRALLPFDFIHSRLEDIINFYQTTDVNAALAFLKKYNVRYIVFGELEQSTYAGPGLEKFDNEEGILWRQVYPAPGVDPQTETIIYEVIGP
jgi:YYY domain-containing protein